MRLPLIRGNARRGATGVTCEALVTWAAAGIHRSRSGRAPHLAEHMFGESLTPLLAVPESPGREHVFASHSFHQVTNYYPMRVVRTRRWKFIYNIAWKLDFPTASDLHLSATWRSTVRESSDLGARDVDAYLRRPRFELTTSKPIPTNSRLGDDPSQVERATELSQRIQNFQLETGDPWFHKWIYE